MKLRVSIIGLVAALGMAAGCSASIPLAQGPQPVFLIAPQDIDRKHIDDYACMSGKPLMCQCYGRLQTACRCSCEF